MEKLDSFLDSLQERLSFTRFENPQFGTKDGIGKIGTIGFCLGLLGGLHFGVALMSLFMSSPALIVSHWSLYFAFLCFFHFGEFFITAVKQPDTVSGDSYLVNHGKSYTLAVVCSWMEYWIEVLLVPSLKKQSFLFWLGITISITGLVVRWIAMWTCGENFSHQIRHPSEKRHQLVTHGIYSIFRHPSYFGWFYWSVGSQLMLLNPICLVGYGYVTWKFFAERIPYEERLLSSSYEEYEDYVNSTVIGIPFIEGRNTIRSSN